MTSQGEPNQRACVQVNPSWCSINRNSLQKKIHRRFVYENNEKGKQKNILLLPKRTELIVTNELMFTY